MFDSLRLRYEDGLVKKVVGRFWERGAFFLYYSALSMKLRRRVPLYRQIIGTLHGSVRTYLTHVFGRALDDDRFIVERFPSTPDSEIRSYSPARRAKGGASNLAR